MIYAIYLASGNSARFGGENKLLHLFEGKAVFAHGLDNLYRVSLRHAELEVIVVTKYLEIVKYAQKCDIRCVYEKEMPDALSYTIQQGINGIATLHPTDYLLFLVADQPLLSEMTIEKFVTAAAQQILTACAYTANTRGNPVMFSATLVDALLALEGDVGGREVLRQYPPLEIMVEHAYELEDVDEKTCLKALHAYYNRDKNASSIT